MTVFMSSMAGAGQQFFNNDGIPLAGGFIYTYAAGTTTPQATYTTASGLIAHANPIVLDSAGRVSAGGEIWLSNNVKYKFVLKDSSNVLIGTYDNIAGINNPTADNVNYTPNVNSLLFGVVSNVQDALNDITNNQNGSQYVGYNQGNANAVNLTAQTKLRQTINVEDFGAPTDGTDATSFINKAIIAAQKSKAFQVTQDENLSVEVVFKAGADYYVVGPILLPSGIHLNGNGCRLVGQYTTAKNDAYSDSKTSIIETAYYDTATETLVSNRNSTVYTQRLINSAIFNFTFKFANCAINAFNMDERCFIKDNGYYDVSAAIRLKSSFYNIIEQNIVRNSCKSTNQYAILLHGNSPSQNTLQSNQFVGCSVAIALDSVDAASGNTIRCNSFEEAHSSAGGGDLNGTGIYFGGGYVQGWSIFDNYFEFVQVAINVDISDAFGMSIFDNYFSGCQWSIISGANGMRNSRWFSNGTADDGGIIRNLIDFSQPGNDVFVQQPSIGSNASTGIKAFVGNFVPGNSTTAESSSNWGLVATGALIAKAQPARINQSSLNMLPFEGGNIVSAPNEVPFTDTPVLTNTTAQIQTALSYDDSNFLIFNFQIIDFAGTYIYHGFVCGSTVYRLDGAAKPLAITNNSGAVRVDFSSLNTNSGASFAIRGMIRHA